jgi:hypothetical protein
MLTPLPVNASGTAGTPPFWEEKASVPLPFAADEVIVYAEVQGGRLWVQGQRTVAILKLEHGGQLESSWPEVVRCATFDVEAQDWVRVIDQNQKAVLKHGSSGGSETQLGIPIGQVTDLRVGSPFGARVALVATLSGNILSIPLVETGTLDSLPVLPAGKQWRRLILPPISKDTTAGISFPVLVALGVENEATVITVWDQRAVPRVVHTLNGKFVSDMALGPDGRVYLVRNQQGAISLLSLHITGVAGVDEVKIGNAFDIEPGYIALSGEGESSTRLLMSRREPSMQTTRGFILLNPVGGTWAEIGPKHMGDTGFAVAEDHLVLMTAESDNSTRLRTFELKDAL